MTDTAASSRLETLEREGYAVARALLPATRMAEIERVTANVALETAGTRNLLDLEWCRQLARELRELLEIDGLAVQCTLFDKTPQRNWLVALHQDLSVPVKDRVQHPALAAWSFKEGCHFVQPPREVLESLIAVRLHVDDCGPESGPLRVVPGSHKRGRLDSNQAASIRNASGEISIPVCRGDALLLKPLILHASSKAIAPTRRRVLHFLFGPSRIGYGLQWQRAE